MSPIKRTLFTAASLFLPALFFSVRVAAEGAGEKPEPPPPFDAQPFSDERTSLPTEAEWKTAPRVTLDPRMPESACSAWRLREWVRVRCNTGQAGAVRMLGGERDGLQMRLHGSANEFVEIAEDAEIVMPVRRGDARVVEIMNIEFGYKGMNSVEPWRVLSEVWPAEDERPTIVFQ